MGHTIYKVSKDQDLYVDWSSIVEGPSFYGTRAEMQEHLIAQGIDRVREEVNERLDCADKNEAENTEIYAQSSFVPRSRMGELVDYLVEHPELHFQADADKISEALGFEPLDWD